MYALPFGVEGRRCPTQSTLITMLEPFDNGRERLVSVSHCETSCALSTGDSGETTDFSMCPCRSTIKKRMSTLSVHGIPAW